MGLSKREFEREFEKDIRHLNSMSLEELGLYNEEQAKKRAASIKDKARYSRVVADNVAREAHRNLEHAIEEAMYNHAD